jgi:hypothetical protein
MIANVITPSGRLHAHPYQLLPPTWAWISPFTTSPSTKHSIPLSAQRHRHQPQPRAATGIPHPQPVSFTITPPSLNPLPSFPGLPSPPANPALQRVWHGLVCEAWREDSNVQETRYRFAIGPRLCLLADGATCRLFQNSTVQQVIGGVAAAWLCRQ